MRLLSLSLGISLALVSTTAFADQTKYKVLLLDDQKQLAGSGESIVFDSITKGLKGTVSYEATKIADPKKAQLYYLDDKNKEKAITNYTGKKLASPITIDEKLKQAEEDALTGGKVHFRVTGKSTSADGTLVPDDGSSTETDAGTNPEPETDAGTDPFPPTNPDPGTGSDDDTGKDSSTTGGGSSNDSSEEEEEDETSGKKGGCSMLRQPTTDSFTLGAAMAGVLGAAFVARRKRRNG